MFTVDQLITLSIYAKLWDMIDWLIDYFVWGQVSSLSQLLDENKRICAAVFNHLFIYVYIETLLSRGGNGSL